MSVEIRGSFDGSLRAIASAAAIALCATVSTGTANAAVVDPLTIKTLVLFEFALPTDADPMFKRIRDISMKMMMNNLHRHPRVGKVIFIQPKEIAGKSAAPAGSGAETPDLTRIAEQNGASYYIHGSLDPLDKNNFTMSAYWWNNLLRQGDEVFRPFGKEDTEDLKRISFKVRKLTGTLVTQMLRPGPPRAKSQKELSIIRIRVSCFKGGTSVGFPHLDRQSTLTLPFLIRSALSRDLNSDKFRVDGYSESEYVQACIKQRKSPDFPTTPYILSGEIVPGGDSGILVAPRLTYLPPDSPPYQFPEGGSRTTLIPLVTGHFSKKDIENFPRMLATYLARKLTIVLTQARLLEIGFNPGLVDGNMGEKTKAAIRDYQEKNNLPVDGKLSEDTLKRLGLK